MTKQRLVIRYWLQVRSLIAKLLRMADSDRPTIPAPESEHTATDPMVPGTIGFDVYLATIGNRSALKAPRLPNIKKRTNHNEG
jgi:hypothetical protein